MMRSGRDQEHLLQIEEPTDAGWPGRDEYRSRPLFPPGCPLRRVQDEALVLLAGGRAVLMQLAHPLIAAGVACHSAFEADPLRRLYGTIHFMHTIVFDDDERAESLDQFHRMHEQIRGRLPERVGIYARGTPYAGDDPELKLWVHATLMDSSLLIYERFVTPMSPEERVQFYADAVRLGRLLEIPEEILPRSFSAFRTYIEEMVAGDQLAVGKTARRLARGVLYPDVGIVQRMSARLLRLVTAGTLPARLREAFRLPWSEEREALLNGLSATTRHLRPFVSPWVWKSPLHGGGLARWILWGEADARHDDGASPYSVNG